MEVGTVLPSSSFCAGSTCRCICSPVIVMSEDVKGESCENVIVRSGKECVNVSVKSEVVRNEKCVEAFVSVLVKREVVRYVTVTSRTVK